MSLAEASAARIQEKLEADRKLDGKLPLENFGWIHLPCEAVVKQDLGTVNSSEVDSASGDLKPIFRAQLHCNKHNVSSRIEEICGE